MIETLARAIWEERCPGMVPSEEDLALYRRAAEAALAVLFPSGVPS